MIPRKRDLIRRCALLLALVFTLADTGAILAEPLDCNDCGTKKQGQCDCYEKCGSGGFGSGCWGCCGRQFVHTDNAMSWWTRLWGGYDDAIRELNACHRKCVWGHIITT